MHNVSDWLFSGNRATIDAIRTAPPPSPLAPVDLSDSAKIHAVMDLAGRIGDQLLSAGTGNSDAKAQIRAILGAYGLHYTHVDITLNTITLYARYDEAANPASTFRVVHSLTTNFSRLTEIDRLVRSIIAGAVPLETAQKILFQIENAPLPFRNRWALLSWGGFAGAVAFMLGGGVAVSIVATLTTIIIVFANAWLASKSLPLFFQNVLGGFLAVVPAALTFQVADAWGLYLPPNLVIASCIVALLAGLTLVQALQDGVTGAPVTSSARFFETLLQTGGIIAGIGTALQFVERVGIILPPIDPSTTSGVLGTTAVKIAGGAAATAFFCLACFCERRATVVAFVTALIASLAQVLVLTWWGSAGMIAVAAVGLLVGFMGGLLSRRYLIPPQITSSAGITPFLPGLALYRGLYSMLNDQFVVGISNLALALATATALAAGVVFGEWMARRIRRPRILTAYEQLRRPLVELRRPTGPRLTSDGRVRQPLHWRRRKRSATQSLWHLEKDVDRINRSRDDEQAP